MWKLHSLRNLGRMGTQLRRLSSTVLKPVSHARQLKEGTSVEGYTLKRIQEIPKLYLTAFLFEHDKTGAEHLHLARDDISNAFCVNFRTTPTNSMGTPHILEHTTLCGSTRYPCRDPFFKMSDRTVATFMNAMTAPDLTLYPFITHNQTDFKNLMSVYLDAVFRPILRELDFMQEGWRLEHADLTDPNSPVVIKGVVFNEMKGVYTDPHEVFREKLMSSLLPSHTYSHCYGGDPIEIPRLTHASLKDFHSTYYHPSNAKFITYGNFDIIDHLRYIDLQYLLHYERRNSDTSVPLERLWEMPRRKQISCPTSIQLPDPSRPGTLAVGYMLGDVCDVTDVFNLQVLSVLMLRGPNAPFYKSLIEKDYGFTFTPTSGFYPSYRNNIFSVGAQGIAENKFDDVVAAIEETFSKISTDGFPEAHIKAVLHRIELGTRHQGENFGLSLISLLSPIWNHGGDPIDALRIDERVKTFKENCRRDPQFLQNLVKKYFVDNPHRLTLAMQPDSCFEADRVKCEEQLLQRMVSRLSEEEKSAVFRKGKELLEHQQKEDNGQGLPELQLSEIPPTIEHFETKETSVAGVLVQCSEQPTNGVTQFRAIFNTSHLSPEQKKLLPLFCSVVTQLSTSRNTYSELANKIDLVAGSMELTPFIGEGIDAQNIEEGILVSSYALDENVPAMFDLWGEILLSTTFNDPSRLEMLARETATELKNGVTDSGHRYCVIAAASRHSPAAALRDTLQGFPLIQSVQEIVDGRNFDRIIQEFQSIAQSTFKKDHLRCALNFSPGSESRGLQSLQKLLLTLPGEPKQGKLLKCVPDFTVDCCKSHFSIQSPVSYSAAAVTGVPFAHDDHAALNVLAELFSFCYLHPAIREQGGAYGSGAHVSLDGILHFFSYRDPLPASSLEIFAGAHSWVFGGGMKPTDISQAHLKVIKPLHKPIAPDNRGMMKFLRGIDNATMQSYRDKVVKVTEEDVKRVANTYLKGAPMSVALLGPEQSNDTTWKSYSI